MFKTKPKTCKSLNLKRKVYVWEQTRTKGETPNIITNLQL